MSRWSAHGLPPGPFRPAFWRSPLRGPWLTAVLGLVLLIGITVLVLTGLLSYAAYDPRLAGNDPTPTHGLFGFYLFDWPTHPVWLYRVTQGVHVIGGLALVPVLLAKLWSVIPRLFEWPAVRSVRHGLERASLLLLVGGAVFEFVTGILNIQIFYVFPFSFYTAHLYGAWVFIGAFVVHVGLKFPQMVKSLRGRSLRRELRSGVAETRPEPVDSELVASAPAPPTVSRRGLLAFVAGGSLTLLGLSFGQTIDGWWRRTALLAPHGRSYGTGPNDFQVNKTAAHVGITRAQTGPGWRLELVGPAGRRTLSRTELLGLPQHTYELPIACVEGWSTDQTWTGVRLADLGRLVGVGAPSSVFVESLQQGGAFRSATFSAVQAADPQSLLALKVNGADLSADHGFPARVIVPAAPGVHNTKWVARVTVHRAAT